MASLFFLSGWCKWNIGFYGERRRRSAGRLIRRKLETRRIKGKPAEKKICDCHTHMLVAGWRVERGRGREECFTHAPYTVSMEAPIEATLLLS